MQIFENYQNKIAPRGSSIYYSLLSLNEKQRFAVSVVRAFAKEVSEIILHCSDKYVAQNKFFWWRGEFQQLMSTTATHPITQALQIVIKEFNLPIELFQEFFEGVARDLAVDCYQDVDELIHYLHHTGGAIERIIAHILTYTDANTLGAVDNFGICIQMVGLLRNLRKTLFRHHSFIPLTDLKQSQLTISQLQQFAITKEVVSLLQMQADRAKHFYQIAIEQLPLADRYKQSSIIILAELSLKLLDQIISPDSNVLKEYISLTPLQKLFLSWKIHRREKKYLNIS